MGNKAIYFLAVLLFAFRLFYGGLAYAQAGQSIVLTADKTEGEASLKINFKAELKNFRPCSNTYFWDFDDGPAFGVADSCYYIGDPIPSRTIASSHTYDKHGTYEAKLKVNDVVSNLIIITVRTSNSSQPVIHGVSGPISLIVGQTGNWTISATDPNNVALAYSVLWGDEPLADTNQMSSPLSSTFLQTATFSHAYAQPGNYTVAFYVRNNSGNTAISTTNVAVIQGQIFLPRPPLYRNLTIGSYGEDVMALQKFLNRAGVFVALNGPGSPNNETFYFGRLTRAALARWQAMRGIFPSVGYFGIKTRTAIMAVFFSK